VVISLIVALSKLLSETGADYLVMSLAAKIAEKITDGIEKVLDEVIACGDFVETIHRGLLGNREEGAYPGRIGKDSVTTKKL
jgi:hypothetical protein